MNASDPPAISAEHARLVPANAVDVAPNPMTNETNEQMEVSAFGMVIFL